MTSNPTIGVLMYTYNRIDDARINMEIIRNVWSENPLLKNVTLVHSFNGQKEWMPEKYLEDEILYLDNPGHYEGAEILLNEGVKAFQEKFPNIDYVIVLAADTWCLKPEYIEKIINSMKSEEKYIATSTWGNKDETNMFDKGMALDFFIINLKWVTESKLFPIRFKEFAEKYQEVIMYENRTLLLERVFVLRFKQAIMRTFSAARDNFIKVASMAYIHKMTEREPVHYKNKEFLEKTSVVHDRYMYFPDIGLLTHHDPVQKQKDLREWKITFGEHGKKFLDATDLSYFNNGFTLSSFTKGDKKIEFN